MYNFNVIKIRAKTRKEAMTNQAWQKLSKEQKEKWEKLATKIEAQDRVVQEEFEDMSSGIFNFEKITPNRRFHGT